MKPSISLTQVSFIAIIALVIIAILVTIAVAEIFATTNPNPNEDYVFEKETTTLRSSIRVFKSTVILNQSPGPVKGLTQQVDSDTKTGIQEIPWLETEADTN